MLDLPVEDMIQLIDLPQRAEAIFEVVDQRSRGISVGAVSRNARSEMYVMIDRRFLPVVVCKIRFLETFSDSLRVRACANYLNQD